MIEAQNTTRTTKIAAIRRLIPPRLQPLARKTYYLFHGLLYVGRTYFCPCCAWHLRRFLPFRQISGRGELCPRCGSFTRHRLTWLYLKNRTTFFSEVCRVLHFAPEFTLQRRLEALDNIEYESADLDSPWAQMRVDITHIPKPDGTYDVVLCSHVLQYVPQDRAAMREIYRILKPGGYAILQVPIRWNREQTYEDPTITTPEAREKAFGHSDFVRIYGKDYPDRLKEAGFEVIVDQYVRTLKDDEITRYCLRRDESLFVCWKRAA